MSATTKPTRFNQLLWIDCIGAALVGVTVIALSGWLSQVEGLPRALLIFTGAVNLVYASYSFTLSLHRRRPMFLIKLLVFANLAWAFTCLALLAAFSASATGFAYLHLGGEALYVGGLAMFEWRYRWRLVGAD